MPAVIWLTQFCLLSRDHSAQQYHISILKNLLKKDSGLETVLCVFGVKKAHLAFLAELCKVIKKQKTTSTTFRVKKTNSHQETTTTM